jgi:hypothetical protein
MKRDYDHHLNKILTSVTKASPRKIPRKSKYTDYRNLNRNSSNIDTSLMNKQLNHQASNRSLVKGTNYHSSVAQINNLTIDNSLQGISADEIQKEEFVFNTEPTVNVDGYESVG